MIIARDRPKPNEREVRSAAARVQRFYHKTSLNERKNRSELQIFNRETSIQAAFLPFSAGKSYSPYSAPIKGQPNGIPDPIG